MIFMGSLFVYPTDPDFERIDVIKIEGAQPLLTIENHKTGLGVSASIFDDQGIIAEIKDNEFQINKQNSFRIERPDTHTLMVYDRWAKLVFKIEYINREAIQIIGTFFHPRESGVLEVRSDTTLLRGSRFDRNCIGVRASGPAFGIPTIEKNNEEMKTGWIHRFLEQMEKRGTR